MKNHLKNTEEYLENIKYYNEKLFIHFRDVIKVDKNLTRQLVSFQANKKISRYRWYKFKEAFFLKNVMLAPLLL